MRFVEFLNGEKYEIESGEVRITEDGILFDIVYLNGDFETRDMEEIKRHSLK